MRNEHTGEYKLSGRTHMIAYTAYSGNAVTKVGLEISENPMLIPRVGGYAVELLFTRD